MSGASEESSIPHANLIRDKLYEKIISAKKAADLEKDGIDYCDIIHLITEKSIKQNAIRAFLQEMYGNNTEDINRNWKLKLKEEKILDDVCSIKRKAVEQQWTEINIDHSHIKLKEQRYKNYEQPLKTRKEMNYRIKQLSDNIKIAENNINMSKDESNQLKFRQEYKEMREEYRFLTNKQRKLRHLSEEKMINSSLSKSQEKLKEIQDRINEITQQEKRLKQIQCLKFNRDSIKSNETSPKKEKERLKRLQQIFIEYSRKDVKQVMLFDEIMRTHKYMNLQNFLRFIVRSGIGTLLSIDERVNIFKTVSQFNPKISFLEFVDILKAICIKQCEKLNVRFKTSILDSFLGQMVDHLETSNRKLPPNPLLSNSNDFIKNLRSQVFSNYHFKLKGHTGKQKQEIEQFLREKKISTKTEPSISKLSSKLSNITLSKVAESRMSRNSGRNRTFNPDEKYMKRKYTNTYKTVNINNQSSFQTKSFKNSLDNNSYSNIFIKKRNILQRQQRQKESKKEDESKRYLIDEPTMSISVVKNQNFINLTPNSYDADREAFESKQLRDIVELDEDDPFLTSHFAHKYSLDTSKTPSQTSNYHF